MRKIQGIKASGKLILCALCAWMAVVKPITVMAEEAGKTETVVSIDSDTAPPASEPADIKSTDTTPSAESKSETPKENPPEDAVEIPSESAAVPPSEIEIPDEDKNAQLGSDSLSIEEYELFRPESSNNTLDTLHKGRSARLMVTVQSSSLQTGDIKAGEILVGKERDSYRTTGSPVVKIASKKGENLVFKVIFPKITYNGKDTVFGFHVKYKGANMETIPLSVDITEAEESDYSSGYRNNEEEESTPQPLVRIERVGSPQPVGAGEKTELTLRIINTSKSSDIEDMMVSLTPGGSMYLMDDTNSRLIKRLNTGKSTEIKVNLQAGQDLTGASQSLDVELKYNYFSANRLVSGNSTQRVIIPVKGNSASGKPLIQISRVGGGNPVSTGEQFQTVIRLENTSQNKDISGLMVTLEPTEQIALMDATDTRLIGNLLAGQAVDIPVLLKASAELSSSASQMIGVSLKFDYDSGKGVTQGTLSGKVVIPTNGGSVKIGSPTPNIIIRNYSYGGNVEAGQVFELVMEVANTSSVTAVENVLMSLDTGEGISINDSSNTIYIPSLAPGATTTQTVRMQALFQSKLQSPKIGISFKYEYMDKKERKQNTTNEAIAIPVYQPDRLEVREPSFTEAIHENEETAISIPYSNKGRGQVFNVEATLEGEIDVMERQQTLGNFESGKNGTIDFVVTPRSTGTFEGKVILVYEDEAMKKKELTIPITFPVQAAAVTDEAETENDTPAGSGGMPFLLPAAGILLLVCGAGLLLWRKRKMSRKQTQTGDDTYEAWEETLNEVQDYEE